MPTAYILVGVPGSGKSTWLKEQGQPNESGIILSTDYYVDEIAREGGKTYSEVFSDVIGWAHEQLDQDLDFGIQMCVDLYWDQTNVSVKSRKKVLDRIPEEYKTVAVFFPTPENTEWVRRLNSRPGKTIPQHVLNSMRDNLTKPTKAEGFDEIIEIK